MTAIPSDDGSVGRGMSHLNEGQIIGVDEGDIERRGPD